jgi:hypothetical protein
MYLKSAEIENVEKILLKLYANKISYDNEDEIINSSNQIDAFAKLCGLQTENPTSLKKRQFTIREEISQYTALRLENTNNISDFWRSQQKRLPILASAIRKFCIIPASSVPSESRFSIANYVARKERSNLSSKNLRYLMISKEKSKLESIKIKKKK